MASTVAGMVIVVPAIQGPYFLVVAGLAMYILPGTSTVFVSRCVGGGGAVDLGFFRDLLLGVAPQGWGRFCTPMHSLLCRAT
ncbi:hypothetical protein CCHOA_03135 [Corynebacterium choanae]|uniref:Uncharacterized protein n=1 Tax=Corynebacterium choanae TaxID=1862358 RepID=A0A3G6J9B5_9CORY|nr:hypothetical protein CCHOA_03135 [Corynebacterium choanae]